MGDFLTPEAGAGERLEVEERRVSRWFRRALSPSADRGARG